MAYYRICPGCGCFLDAGERCDCRDQEKAAPDATDIQSGKVEKGLPTNFSASILPKKLEEFKYEVN